MNRFQRPATMSRARPFNSTHRDGADLDPGQMSARSINQASMCS